MDIVAAHRAARAAHDALVLALRELESAEQNAVLRFAEILHARHFVHLGFASIWHYGVEGLGFSRAKTGHFVRLAKDVKRLPALEQALAKNEITWTKAREVGKVATPENQQQWIARAKTTSRRDLEREVRQVRRTKRPAAATVQTSLVPAPDLPAGDPPVRVSFELTGLQLAEFEKLMEKVQGRRSREEVLLLAMAALSEHGQSPRRDSPPVQLVVHRCDVCKQASVPTGRGDRRLSAGEAAAATCDAVRFEPHRRSRASIPPKLRRQVLARDGDRCRRCGRTSHLNVHHRHKQEHGGPHTLANCETLCRACHVALHREEELLQRGVTVESIAPG